MRLCKRVSYNVMTTSADFIFARIHCEACDEKENELSVLKTILKEDDDEKLLVSRERKTRTHYRIKVYLYIFQLASNSLRKVVKIVSQYSGVDRIDVRARSKRLYLLRINTFDAT